MSQISNDPNFQDIAQLLEISFDNKLLQREVNLQNIATKDENLFNIFTHSNIFVMNLLDQLAEKERDLQQQIDNIVLEKVEPSKRKNIYTLSDQNVYDILNYRLISQIVEDLQKEKAKLIEENNSLKEFLKFNDTNSDTS